MHGMQAGTGGNGGHVHQEQELGQLGKTNTGALQPVGPRPFRTVPQLMHACAPFAQAESPACTRQHERQWSACPDVRMVARHVHCDRGLQIMARSWYCRVAGAKQQTSANGGAGSNSGSKLVRCGLFHERTSSPHKALCCHFSKIRAQMVDVHI